MNSTRIIALMLMLCIGKSAKIAQQPILTAFLQQDSSAVTPDAETVTDSTDKDSVLNFVQSDAEMQSDEADEGTEKEQNLFVQDDNTSGEISSSDEDTEKQSSGFLQNSN